MRAFTRLGALVFATVLSLMTILTLLPQSRYTEHIRKIKIGGTSINDVTGGLWDWASGDDGEEGGVRLVVFGDSWVDDRIEENGIGKGRSWTDVLCEELACTSQINLAASQPAASYPSAPPTGALASIKAYLSTIENIPGHNKSAEVMLPDFEAQIKSFIALPQPKHKLRETIFVMSFGTWDVWHYAALDYAKALEAQNKAVAEMFAQLDNLYAHHRATLEATHLIERPHNESHVVSKPQFRVVIPKLFDPTMLPGWLSQRPAPLKPTTVAEVQKNAIHLLSEWDFRMENSIKPWFASTPEAATTSEWIEPAPEKAVSGGENKSQSKRGKSEKSKDKSEIAPPQKDIYYYDLNRFLTEVILEHQLEDEGLSDGSGLGSKESPYISVYDPCIKEADSGEDRRLAKAGSMQETRNAPDINGLLVCESPDEHLFWDDFTMGSTAKEKVGREVAKMIKLGHTLRAAWGDGTVPGINF